MVITQGYQVIPEKILYANAKPENKKLINVEEEAIHIILYGIGNDIYSIGRGSIESYYTRFYKMMNERKWSRFVTIVTQQKNLDNVSYHTLFDILKKHQNEVNEIRAERMVRNANPLALVAAAQHYPYDYTQSPKPYKTHAQSSRQTPSTRSHATARNKGKEIVKPPPPPSDQHMKKTMMKNRLREISIYRKVWHLLQNTSRTSIDLPTTTLELHQTLGTRMWTLL
ncbi:hypothetical protein Tco_1428872 [Tanacetum coccineum]